MNSTVTTQDSSDIFEVFPIAKIFEDLGSLKVFLRTLQFLGHFQTENVLWTINSGFLHERTLRICLQSEFTHWSKPTWQSNFNLKLIEFELIQATAPPPPLPSLWIGIVPHFNRGFFNHFYYFWIHKSHQMVSGSRNVFDLICKFYTQLLPHWG